MTQTTSSTRGAGSTRGMTVADLMDPASEIAEHATLADLEPALRRDELGFMRSGLGWEAIVPRLVVGLPSSRRVIDVPRVAVTALEPDSDALGVLPLLERSALPSSPVVTAGRLVGRLAHERLRFALRDEHDDDLLSELTTLRQASSAITHDLANVLMVALWEVEASPQPSPSASESPKPSPSASESPKPSPSASSIRSTTTGMTRPIRCPTERSPR